MFMKFFRLGLSLLAVCLCTSACSADAPENDHAEHVHDMGAEMPSVGVAADINLDFELVNGFGELAQDEDFLGKNVLLAFGFTHCPDVCPLIAANMANALKVADVDSVGLFVSVDNERDSPEYTHKYASSFGPNMFGLSGSYAQLSATAKNHNATFVITKTPDSYSVQHSPGIFLFSPDGELIDVFAINSLPEDIAAAMQ